MTTATPTPDPCRPNLPPSTFNLQPGPHPSNQPLSQPQHQALLALLQGATRKAAAEAAGVGESTIYRWLDEPPFAQALRDHRFALYSDGILQLQLEFRTAVATLSDVMKNGQREHARVNAARVLLHHATKSIEIDDYATEYHELANNFEAAIQRLTATPTDDPPPPEPEPAPPSTLHASEALHSSPSTLHDTLDSSQNQTSHL